MNFKPFKKKKNFLKLLLVTVLFLHPTYIYADNIENLPINQLLGEYQQLEDLSTITKKEAAGTVIVFSRQDLDRMKIKTLNELIDLLPTLVYSENALGFSDIGYAPYQLNTLNPIVIYINDREAFDPFGGGGFQVLGQLDIGYIDHIEIYSGFPSYDIGFDSAPTVMKIYTKKGYRENATVMDSSYSTYGTVDNYIYQGKKIKNWSYLLYMDGRKLNRKNYYHNTHKISRDKNSVDFWGEVENDNIRVEIQAYSGDLDDFIGDSWNISPNKNRTDYKYIYSGIYYTSNDGSLKAYINYSKTLTDTKQEADGPLGLIFKKYQIGPGTFMKLPYFYDSSDIKINEDLLNIGLVKEFKISKNDNLLIGGRYRYERFKFHRIKLGDVYEPDIAFDSETYLTNYIENKFYIGKKHAIITSLEFNKQFNNGGVKNYNLLSYKLGYIFNSEKLTLKNFIYYADLPISPYVLYYQKRISPQSSLSTRKGVMMTSEAIYRYSPYTLELEVGKALYKNSVYFCEQGYKNSPHIDTLNFISTRIRYDINPLNSIRFGVWVSHLKDSKNLHKVYGGHIALFDSIGKFSFYNALIMRKNKYMQFTDHKYHWIYNTTIIYNASRNLSLYIKGINLFNDSTTSDYIRINPVTHQITRLNGVSDYDRRIWVGLEYKF